MTNSKSSDWPYINISFILEKHGFPAYEDEISLLYFSDEPTLKPTHIMGKNQSHIKKINSCNYELLGEVEKHNTKFRFEAVTLDIKGEKIGFGIYGKVLKGGTGEVYYNAGKTLSVDPEKDGISIIDFLLELQIGAEGGI